MPYGVGGASAKEIWEYSVRELTQTKFQFWSAIIPPQGDFVSVASGTDTWVDIQPPNGETWLLWIYWGINGVDAGAILSLVYYDHEGTLMTERIRRQREGTTNYDYGHYYNSDYIGVTRILTNSLYATISFYQNTGGSRTGQYTYCGFKLSKPLYSPKRLGSSTTIQWKRKPTHFSVPTEIEVLEPYIADIYDSNRGSYRQAIILEEDTPLAIDPKTNFPVERLTVICYVDDFINNILKRLRLGQLDLQRSGWKKYFEKWKAEGIKVL